MREAEENRIMTVTAAPMEEMKFVETRLSSFAKALPDIKNQGYEIDFLGSVQTNEGFQ